MKNLSCDLKFDFLWKHLMNGQEALCSWEGWLGTTELDTWTQNEIYFYIFTVRILFIKIVTFIIFIIIHVMVEPGL